MSIRENIVDLLDPFKSGWYYNPAMEHMEPEELERTRRNLLKYCELDTLAMVKIWERLKEVSKE